MTIQAPEQAKETSLVERVADISTTSLSPHELAQELGRLHDSKDRRGLLDLRDAYIICVSRKFPKREWKEIIEEADANLYIASILADRVRESGYEASGQLLGLSSKMTSSHALKGCPDGQLFASQKAGFPTNL